MSQKDQDCRRMQLDTARPTTVGIYWDEIYEKGPDGQDVLVRTTEKRHNIITINLAWILPALLKEDPVIGGIQFHAVGQGDASWDTSLPDPTKFDTQLFDELSRLAPDGAPTYIRYGEGTAQSGSTTTIVDPDRWEGTDLVGRFEPDDFFNGDDVVIVAGTNVGETRTITDYDQATGTLTVGVAFTNPIDATSVYQIGPIPLGSVSNAIEIRTTWDYGTAADAFNFKYFREQGLFGGTATATADSGQMLDRMTHERIWKAPTTKIIRFIDLIFRV